MRFLKKIVIFFIICTLGTGCSKVTQEAKPYEDLSVIFFPGGTEDFYFSKAIYRGARDAERLLGPKVEYIWSAWDSKKMVIQFKEAIAQKPDLICIMGHPGEEMMGPLIAEAFRNNILVTSTNVDLPESEEKFMSDGFGYVGQDIYASGKKLGEAVPRKFMLKSGVRVLLTGVKSIPRRGDRTLGIEEALKNGGIIVDYIEDSPDDLALLKKNILTYLEKNPQVNIIVDDIDPVFLALALQEAGYKENEIRVAGFDLSKEGYQLMKAGYLHLVLDQQPYYQGYLSLLQGCMSKKLGLSGLHIDTGSLFFDLNNLDQAEKILKLME